MDGQIIRESDRASRRKPQVGEHREKNSVVKKLLIVFLLLALTEHTSYISKNL
jgi:hypothetical protein